MKYTPPEVEKIRLERCIEITSIEEERVRQELIRQMLLLSTRLRREADALKNSSHLPNSLGVIQGAGSDIDRLCGEYSRLHDFLRSLGKEK